jgi:hypothetical protein
MLAYWFSLGRSLGLRETPPSVCTGSGMARAGAARAAAKRRNFILNLAWFDEWDRVKEASSADASLHGFAAPLFIHSHSTASPPHRLLQIPCQQMCTALDTVSA